MAVIMVSLTVLLMTLTWTEDTLARAGRGGSAGSRASRSYAAPARPSPAPVTPGSSSRAARREPAAEMAGRWRGGPRGLLAGGLLGGLLFGGPGGGMGVLDALALGGLAYLALRLLRTPAGGPAHAVFASAPGGAGAGFADSRARGRRDDVEPADGHVRRADPRLDREEFAATAAETFEKVQHAWAARDLRPIAALLTPDMQANFQRDCDQMAARGRLTRVEDVSVGAAEIVDTWQENGHDWATVRIDAQVVDYTVEEQSGQVIDGNDGEPTAVAELWTFTRPIWAKGWRVSAIQQPVRQARGL
jgi:predicted lipid-binding transport protein (Tim44 family)